MVIQSLIRNFFIGIMPIYLTGTKLLQRNLFKVDSKLFFTTSFIFFYNILFHFPSLFKVFMYHQRISVQIFILCWVLTVAVTPVLLNNIWSGFLLRISMSWLYLGTQNIWPMLEVYFFNLIMVVISKLIVFKIFISFFFLLFRSSMGRYYSNSLRYGK